MSRKDWIDARAEAEYHVLPSAFKLRPAPKDEAGLSVDVKSARSCHESLNKCHGVASLHTGRVRDLGLNVIVDAFPHGNITGLPREAQDRTEAERFASLLAKQARIVPPEGYRLA
jgi:hypothetical protein